MERLARLSVTLGVKQHGALFTDSDVKMRLKLELTRE